MDAPCCDVFELENGKIKRFDCYPEGSIIFEPVRICTRWNVVQRHFARQQTSGAHVGNASLAGLLTARSAILPVSGLSQKAGAPGTPTNLRRANWTVAPGADIWDRAVVGDYFASGNLDTTGVFTFLIESRVCLSFDVERRRDAHAPFR
jgi:hypothetical protein